VRQIAVHCVWDISGREELVGTAALVERLEARITAEQKQLFKEAAAARGISLTDFVVNSAHEAAIQTLEAKRTLHLGREEQRVFVEALLNPEPPSRQLRTAVRRQGYAKKRTRSPKR
jgi:uncharacterized protein (DUF1778 family)